MTVNSQSARAGVPAPQDQSARKDQDSREDQHTIATLHSQSKRHNQNQDHDKAQPPSLPTEVEIVLAAKTAAKPKPKPKPKPATKAQTQTETETETETAAKPETATTSEGSEVREGEPKGDPKGAKEGAKQLSSAVLATTNACASPTATGTGTGTGNAVTPGVPDQHCRSNHTRSSRGSCARTVPPALQQGDGGDAAAAAAAAYGIGDASDVSSTNANARLITSLCSSRSWRHTSSSGDNSSGDNSSPSSSSRSNIDPFVDEPISFSTRLTSPAFAYSRRPFRMSLTSPDLALGRISILETIAEDTPTARPREPQLSRDADLDRLSVSSHSSINSESTPSRSSSRSSTTSLESAAALGRCLTGPTPLTAAHCPPSLSTNHCLPSLPEPFLTFSLLPTVRLSDETLSTTIPSIERRDELATRRLVHTSSSGHMTDVKSFSPTMEESSPSSSPPPLAIDTTVTQDLAHFEDIGLEDDLQEPSLSSPAAGPASPFGLTHSSPSPRGSFSHLPTNSPAMRSLTGPMPFSPSSPSIANQRTASANQRTAANHNQRTASAGSQSALTAMTGATPRSRPPPHGNWPHRKSSRSPSPGQSPMSPPSPLTLTSTDKRRAPTRPSLTLSSPSPSRKISSSPTGPQRSLTISSPLAEQNRSPLTSAPILDRRRSLITRPGRRKSAREIEAEMPDENEDDDLPDDYSLWNVPLSPGAYRTASSAATSPAASVSSSPERNGSILGSSPEAAARFVGRSPPLHSAQRIRRSPPRNPTGYGRSPPRDLTTDRRSPPRDSANVYARSPPRDSANLPSRSPPREIITTEGRYPTTGLSKGNSGRSSSENAVRLLGRSPPSAIPPHMQARSAPKTAPLMSSKIFAPTTDDLPTSTSPRAPRLPLRTPTTGHLEQYAFGPGRAKSWSHALADLSSEARDLSAELDAHAQHRAAITTAEIAHGVKTSPRRTQSALMELPSLRRSDVLIDPLPCSKEKEAVLSRTRPSWLPPKSPKEERRHLREYQQMMARSRPA